MDIKCPVCGAPCLPGEKFCQNCGSKLPQAVPAAPVMETPVPPAAPVVEAPAAPTTEAPSAPVFEAPAAPVPPAAPVYAAPAAPVPPAAPVYQTAPAYPPQQNVPNYAPKAAPVPPAAPQYTPPPYGAPAYAPAYAPAPAAPKKKKTGLIIGLCVGAAVLIAAAILLYFFVLSPTSITLSEETVTMECYDSIDLTAEVKPGSALNKDVKWTSSDEDVATVYDGMVTAWEAGTCTITATTSNGKSASCTITVEAYAPMDDHESVILGDWHLTYVYNIETSEEVTAEEFGATSDLTIYSDHTASMTFNDDSKDDLTWQYYYVDDDGDYLYGLDDGVEESNLYYIVDDGALWLFIEGNCLTYER